VIDVTDGTCNKKKTRIRTQFRNRSLGVPVIPMFTWGFFRSKVAIDLTESLLYLAGRAQAALRLGGFAMHVSGILARLLTRGAKENLQEAICFRGEFGGEVGDAKQRK